MILNIFNCNLYNKLLKIYQILFLSPAYVAQMAYGIERVEACYPRLYQLAIGGTAVGTGLNTRKGFAEKCCKVISELTGNLFEDLNFNIVVYRTCFYIVLEI